MGDIQIRFGQPEQWEAFAERNRAFLDRLPALRAAFRDFFIREFSPDAVIDQFVFIAGRLAVDDFFEILLVCGNAEAYAAQKILRPMFERVVTLRYLHLHPDELDKYLTYYWVSQQKLINAIESTFRQGLLDPSKVTEAREHYEQVKDDYKVTLCPKCKTTRPNFSWTPKDIITMAKEIGFGDLVVPAYYLPMQHTHPTVKGMMDRLEITASGGMTVNERLVPLLADRMLCAAHGLVLYAVGVQIEHFKLDPKLFNSLESDFQSVWKRPDLGPAGAETTTVTGAEHGG